MKSLETLYKEAQENEELKKEFVAAFKEGRIEDFLSAHDCDATADDVMALLNGAKKEAATEDDLRNVAGGCGSSMSCGNDCTYGCYTGCGNGLGDCP